MEKSGGESLARHVPHIQVLSLRGCGLDRPIDHSLSSLRSLIAVDLRSNNIPAGQIPEFFAYFHNLSVLQLSHMNLNGVVPREILSAKKSTSP